MPIHNTDIFATLKGDPKHGLMAGFQSSAYPDPDEIVYEPLHWLQNSDGNLKTEKLTNKQHADLAAALEAHGA